MPELPATNIDDLLPLSQGMVPHRKPVAIFTTEQVQHPPFQVFQARRRKDQPVRPKDVAKVSVPVEAPVISNVSNSAPKDEVR